MKFLMLPRCLLSWTVTGTFPHPPQAPQLMHCILAFTCSHQSCLHYPSSKVLCSLASRPCGHLTFSHLPIPRATMETHPSWCSVRHIEIKHISYEQKASASTSRERMQLSPERFHEWKEANKYPTGASVFSWKRKKKKKRQNLIFGKISKRNHCYEGSKCGNNKRVREVWRPTLVTRMQ